MPLYGDHMAHCVNALTPPVYAEYIPAITDAFDYFLRRIDDEKQARMEIAMSALGPEPDPLVSLLVVMQQCPTLHKLGQVLARDTRLDEGVRSLLQQLETFPATLPNQVLEDEVARELGGNIETYQIELLTQCAMEASIAYVIPVLWSKPGSARRERAVLKLIKPNLAETLGRELEIFSEIAQLLETRCDELGLPAIQFEDTFDSVRMLLEQETDFTVELRNLADIWDVLKTNTEVQIPRPLPFSTSHCLAMRYIPGTKITDAAAELPEGKRRRIAKSLARAMLCDPLLSRDDVSLIHGDPHAGNLKFTDDERVGILDWSLVSRLEKADREALVMVMLGAVTFSAKRIEYGLRNMKADVTDEATTRDIIEEALAAYRNGKRPGIKWFTKIFDDLVKSGVVFPAQFTILRKNIFTIEGVLADIDPTFSLSREFARQAAKSAALDWPRRITTKPWSKDFAIPLANTDIMTALARTPVAIARSLRKTKRDGPETAS